MHRQECPSTLLRASLCYLQAAAGRQDKQEECPFGLAPERPLHGRAGRTEVRTALQRGHDISCPYKEKQGPGFPIKVIGAPA
ncbi:MAG: hypothetical protein DMG33_17830 [Acidobacteria bacterium]|nr:MAG: hypothetical protein DMG33_17830 [Acidobacteriota bacterium]